MKRDLAGAITIIIIILAFMVLFLLASISNDKLEKENKVLREQLQKLKSKD